MEISSKQPKKPDKNGWILPTILGSLFLIWFFSTRDYRTPEEKMTDEIEETVSRARLQEKITQSRQDIYEDAVNDMKKELDNLNIRYTSVEISENHFVWVYMSENGKDGNYLANTLCVRAKKHFMKGVTLFNTQGDTIGRSICK